MADEAELSGEEAASADPGGSSRAGSCAPSGSGLFESDNGSEDDMPVEEFALDEQEAADTTALQHFHNGRDIQGIPWERFRVRVSSGLSAAITAHPENYVEHLLEA